MQKRYLKFRPLIICLTILSATFAFILVQQGTSDNLVLHYTFDEGSGNIVYDSSRYGNDGTIYLGNPLGRAFFCYDGHFGGGPAALAEGFMLVDIYANNGTRIRYTNSSATWIDMNISDPTGSVVFTFAVASDGHYGLIGTDYETDYYELVSWLNGISGLDVALILGDIAQNGTVDELKGAKAYLDNLIMPYYVAKGNHDGTEEDFKSVFGLTQLDYSVDLGTFYHFIILNASVHEQPLTDEDLDWLENDLQANTGKLVFIFGHVPQVKTGESGDVNTPRFRKIVDGYSNVVGVFFGHTHTAKVYSSGEPEATRVSGVRGTALSLDGINNYVETSETSSLTFKDEVTVSAWVKLTGNNTSDHEVLLVNGITEDTRLTFVVKEKYSPYALGYWDKNNGWKTSTTVLTRDVWYHIVWVVKSENYVKFYVNGSLSVTVSLASSFPAQDGVVRIGRDDKGRWFRGIVDDLRIYSRELTADEIEELFRLYH